jgi:hypothetical protein
MPETKRPTEPMVRGAVPLQRGTAPRLSSRQLREQDWATLVSTYRLLSRLVIERTKHVLPDDADTLAEQAVLVEEELEHSYPVRWPRLHPRLLLEEATWWAEDHDEDILDCRACWYQGGMATERIYVPRPRGA